MESVTSSTWTPLGLESSCTRVLFTHFIVVCWVGSQANLDVYPNVLKISSLIAIMLLVSS